MAVFARWGMIPQKNVTVYVNGNVYGKVRNRIGFVKGG